jgi:hypothetical protein
VLLEAHPVWVKQVFLGLLTLVVSIAGLATVARVELTAGGQAVLLPARDAAPTRVVAFLPERDRAALDLEAPVRVELDALGWANAPALHGRVTRVAQDPATAHEIDDLLGAEARDRAPVYRVEMDLEDDAAHAKLAPVLRPGMRAHASFLLRSQSLLSIARPPLRLWQGR